MTATAYIAGTEPLSPGQRRALFAVGKRRGLSIDGLRELTPAGSISALTRAQAAGLLDRLNVGTDYEHPRPAQRQPRRPRGVYAIASEGQRRKIEALRIDLGWKAEKLQAWLAGRHHLDGRRMTRIDSSSDARDVIELLKVVLVKQREARQTEAEASSSASWPPDRTTPAGAGDAAQPDTTT